MTDAPDPIPAGAEPVAVLLDMAYCVPFGQLSIWGKRTVTVYSDARAYAAQEGAR